MSTQCTTTPEQWIVGTDTDRSAIAIWAVMMGVAEACAHGAADHPAPPATTEQFGTCYRLLELFPAWRARLGEVSARFPAWRPLVEHWSDLVEAFGSEERLGIHDSGKQGTARLMQIYGLAPWRPETVCSAHASGARPHL